jgi:hypothetical protein
LPHAGFELERHLEKKKWQESKVLKTMFHSAPKYRLPNPAVSPTSPTPVHIICLL